MHHFLHEFWETLGYLANTIIFVMAGVCIAFNTNYQNLETSDIGATVAIYVGALGVRALLFAMCFPAFERMTYGWTWKEALIGTWGGLRGAVGLALALDVSLSSQIDESIRDLVLVHTSVMVVLTLVVNASTLRPLLSALKFISMSHEELTMLNAVSERLQAPTATDHMRHQHMQPLECWLG